MIGQHLKGKVAIVTGSGRGLGKAIALRLAAAGADVVVHDENEDAPRKFGESRSLEEVADAVRATGKRSLALFGDLSKAEVAPRIVDQVMTEFKRIDTLVNNAGGDIGAKGNKPDPNDLFISEEDLQVVLNRNLLTMIHMCQAAVPVMIKQRQGRIVNLSSAAAFVAVKKELIYSAAKLAVVHFTRSLAASLREHGINVNSIAPGGTASGRFRATLAQRGLTEESLKPRGVLDRVGQPEDIAKVVEFFSSELGDFVSGENLLVDGGSFATRYG